MEKYNIEKQKDYYRLHGNRWINEVNPRGYDTADMDHFEIYQKKNKGGYVAIFSLYGMTDGPDEQKPEPYILKLGYKKCDPLYNDGVVTYYKEIPYKKII